MLFFPFPDARSLSSLSSSSSCVLPLTVFSSRDLSLSLSSSFKPIVAATIATTSLPSASALERASRSASMAFVSASIIPTRRRPNPSSRDDATTTTIRCSDAICGVLRICQWRRLKRIIFQSLLYSHFIPNSPFPQAGSSISVLNNIFREDGYFEGLPISIIESWYQRDGYIKSMADLVQKELLSFSNS